MGKIDSGRQNGTVAMAVAIIAASLTTSITVHPILPRIFAEYRDLPNVALLVPMIISLPALVSIFVAPLVGWLSDKIGRRSFVIVASIFATLFGMAPLWLESLPAILVTRALMGLVTGSLAVCTSALIGDLFDDVRRKDVFGTKFAISGAAHVGVNILMGYLAYAAWRNAFLVFSWGIVAAMLMLLLVPREVKSSRHATPSAPDYLIPWRRCLPLFLAVFLGIVAFDVVITGVPFLLNGGAMHSDTRVAGMALATSSLGMFLGAAAYPFIARKVSGAGVWALTFLFAAAGFTTISFGSPEVVAPIFAGTLIACIGTGMVQPNSLSMLMALVPPRARGRIVGLQMTFFLLGFVVGPFIGVTLAQEIGSSAVYIFGALALILLALFALGARGASAPDEARLTLLRIREEGLP